MSGGVSLKWHATAIAVSTGFAGDSPPQAISAITKANPAVVTSNSHGLDDGDVVKLTGIVGMEELNDGVYVVQNSDPNTFELADVNSAGYGTYVSGGVVDPATFSNYCQLTGYNRAGGSAPESDVSTICSTAAETELGLPDFGTTTLDFLFNLQDSVQQALQAADLSKDIIAVRVVLPKSNGTMVQLGRVQSTGESAANAGHWAGTATIRNSGPRVDILA
jgi:hypothetical protein